VREGQIHPAVFIEVESRYTHRGWQLLLVEIDGVERPEFRFAGIEIDRSSRLTARDDEVNCAVIIEIGGYYAGACSCKTESRFGRHIRECVIPIVAPKNIVGRRARRS